ncbi:MAG: hypothetical protein ACYDHW_00130 [Syntrophorhabdaceae bacterium]
MPLILPGIYCLAVCVLTYCAALRYPGRIGVYLIFSLLLNALFVIGFTEKKIFFDTFIGIFLWLGFWLKVSIRLAFMDGKFHEPVGAFSGTGTAYDQVLLITTCGILGLMAGIVIRRKFLFSYPVLGIPSGLDGIFGYYKQHRRSCLIAFCIAFTITGVTNIIFGFYQRGAIPRTILPFGLNGIYSWLLQFGLAWFGSMILECELRSGRKPFLVSGLTLVECFVSNVSLLSRGMILNAGAIFLGIFDSAKRRSMSLGRTFPIFILIVLGILFILSLSGVNYIRMYSVLSLVDKARVALPSPRAVNDPPRAVAAENRKSQEPRSYTGPDTPGPPEQLLHPSTIRSKAIDSMIKTSLPLLIDRWVGIEGLMAVSSYPGLGWELFRRAWRERFSLSGTSLYDVTFIRSPYLEYDLSLFHFISLPGMIAFFWYPGSILFLFFAMLIAYLIAAAFEITVFKLSGSIIVCSLIGQVIAYRYSSFGYVPRQSYLLFGSIIINALIFYFLNKFLSSRRKARETDINAAYI